MDNLIFLDWELGFTLDPGLKPEEFVPASVPGAVQLDWSRAKGMGDPHWADNWRDYLWMEDAWWLYRARLKPPKLNGGERLHFIAGGVDYAFKISLCGEMLHEQEGMFTPVDIDLGTSVHEGALLEILINPAPKSRPSPPDRVQANQSCKPAVAYGWDFHPRLIPLGVWQHAGLKVVPATRLVDAEISYTLSPDFTSADVSLAVRPSAPKGGRIRWTLTAPDGRAAITAGAPADNPELLLREKLANPELWWPNGHGRPALYTSSVELLSSGGKVLDCIHSRVGFRSIRLVMHEGAWDEPANNDFPKPRSNPPTTIEINGRRIFAKGSNWVCPDIFPGRVPDSRYREQVEMAARANFNILRCWGGAAVPPDAFYDACDELGIMVWQEFPLACNRYEGTPPYLKVLDQESRSIIRRLRSRPSLAIWCGGNELFNSWSGMTDQDLALRLLNRNCYDLDPMRPFLMTSPLSGMGHGHYVFRDADGRETYQIFSRASFTAYTEFGCPGPANTDVLRSIIPEKDIFPPKPGTPWETHHAFLAWQPNSHLLLDVIEHYFGSAPDLQTLVDRGQLLQSEGLKSIFEEVRRQKPKAAMALNWCFNEPWPAAANMSMLCWPSIPKPALAAVSESCRPVLASAKIAKYSWQEGEIFNPELWILNDSPAPVASGRIEAWLLLGGAKIFLLGWDHPEIAANCNLPGPLIRRALPAAAADMMTLELRVPANPGWSSSYRLRYSPLPRHDAVDGAAARPLNQ